MDMILAHSLAKLSDLARVDSDHVTATSENIFRDKSNKIEDEFKMAFLQLLNSYHVVRH